MTTEVCGICQADVSPEFWGIHQDSHRELGETIPAQKFDKVQALGTLLVMTSLGAILGMLFAIAQHPNLLPH